MPRRPCFLEHQAAGPAPPVHGEEKMPKMKTKASAKKRFKVTASGKVKAKQAYKNHMLGHKPQKMKRNARGTEVLAEADAKIVKRYMLPYA
jgi:large subunit ribosomal protein L35